MKPLLLSIIIIASFSSCFAQAQKDHPWTQEELMPPAKLNQLLQQPQKNRPVVLDVGPAGMIKGAIEMGPAETPQGMKNLKAELAKLPKDTPVVVYCGCCPFSHCPNAGPAFSELKKMGFQHPYLLNLSHNLKADWIDKGYPLADE